MLVRVPMHVIYTPLALVCCPTPCAAKLPAHSTGLCTIIPKGAIKRSQQLVQSLKEWASRRTLNIASKVYVLLHLVQRLNQLHELGYCHRNIKPENFLWRRRTRTWTLSSFTACAKIGMQS